jgi:hypothetical protein
VKRRHDIRSRLDQRASTFAPIERGRSAVCAGSMTEPAALPFALNFQSSGFSDRSFNQPAFCSTFPGRIINSIQPYSLDFNKISVSAPHGKSSGLNFSQKGL